MKRPILGFLAAAMLCFGLSGLSPARAATVISPTRTLPTPAHDDDHDHDHDHDHGHRRCAGLIFVCLG